MIKFEDFSFGFPQKDLYEDINFEINTGDHAVLIGSNGCGKSTLVDLIMHEDRYTYDGLIRMQKGIRIGYVSQFVESETTELSVNDFLAAPFRAMLAELDEIGALMAEDYEKYGDRFQQIMDEIEAVDGYNYESNIGRALAAAGLSEFAERSVNELSGGEYKLFFILRNMLLRPQLLIMDEPDVFLDFENLMALIKLINSYDGTVLTITHNRVLLSQCFDKVLDIENKSVREFPGTFAEYNTWMLETKVQLFEHAKDFDDFIAKQEQIVEKIQVIAEMTAEPKMGKQLKARASYIARLRKMRGDDPFLEEHNHEFNLCFAADGEAAEPLEITADNYTIAYDDNCLLENVSFIAKPGEKVAIVGTNGTGKTSLLRAVYADMKTVYGDEIGFFRQITESDSELMLSGGEQNLRQIEELCTVPHRALILDEPTSHLDIYAQIELEKAIRAYEGTVLMVSHDLFAVTGCADRIILIENGTIREMSPRAYRKSIYKNYFTSDIFEAEKQRIDLEIRASEYIRRGEYDKARKALGMPEKPEL